MEHASCGIRESPESYVVIVALNIHMIAERGDPHA